MTSSKITDHSIAFNINLLLNFNWYFTNGRTKWASVLNRLFNIRIDL